VFRLEGLLPVSGKLQDLPKIALRQEEGVESVLGSRKALISIVVSEGEASLKVQV
jgi:hypothetical protein